MFEKLNALAQEFKPRMIDFAQRLIRINGLPGDEKEVADLFIEELKKLHYDEVFRDGWGNVVGVIKGDLPGPSILFNGHLDQVPSGDLKEWGKYDPYGGVIDIDKAWDQEMTREEDTEVIHGRGASDIKSGASVAAYTGAMLLEMRKRFGYKMKGTFILSMVIMEELGDMAGMHKLMDDTFPEHGLKADACVSFEASSLKLALGSRGRVEMLVKVHGVLAHGSRPWAGVNAVEKSAKLIELIRDTVRAEAKTDPNLGKSSSCLTFINCEPGATGVVPDLCIFSYDRRFPPGETAASCIAQVQRLIDGLTAKDPEFKATVEIDTPTRTTYTGKTFSIPVEKEAYKLDTKHPVATACAAALEAVGQEAKWHYWDFGTDLPVAHVLHGIPSIGYSGMQEFYAHRTIDRVRIDFLEKSMAGTAAIYLKLTGLEAGDFKL